MILNCVWLTFSIVLWSFRSPLLHKPEAVRDPFFVSTVDWSSFCKKKRFAPIVHYIEKMHHLFANGHAIFAKHFPCIRKCRSFSQNSKEDVLISLMLVPLKSIFPKCSGEIISEMPFYAPAFAQPISPLYKLSWYIWIFTNVFISWKCYFKKEFNHFEKLTYK